MKPNKKKKKKAFLGFLGNEKPITREYAADAIRYARESGHKVERIVVRSSHAIDLYKDGRVSQRIILVRPADGLGDDALIKCGHE